MKEGKEGKEDVGGTRYFERWALSRGEGEGAEKGRGNGEREGV